MPKTRQQRMAEARAGHPSSPLQVLEDKPRGPRRTRAKTPSATVAAGPVVPAAQSAVLGEPQALLRVWVDAAPEASGRLVDDPTHQLTIPSSLVPELVSFIENIRNHKPQNVLESSSKPSLYQLTQSQVMAEATLPKQPEPAKKHSAKKLANGRKSAFRRNPLLPNSTLFTSQPLEPSLDTSAAGGISSLTTQSAQEGNLTPSTPRTSKWGFDGLLESARSIKSRLGFSPLTSVSESPELSHQTPTPSTVQSLAETTAPTQPKKKASAPISARDKSADQNEGEARQANIKVATAKPSILRPSRSLDRTSNNKRKRWGEPVATPSPEDGSYGRGETNIRGDSEEEGETEGQPSKIRRTGEAEGFTSQVAGHHIEYQGGNVFAEYEAARKASNTGMQPLAKLPIPITNFSGTFKVPSPGDIDWSDSGSDEEEGNIAGLEDITPSRINSGDASPGYRPSKLPEPQRILRPSQQEAVRKARAKVLQYKPRNPSRLCQSSRAYPSPPPADRPHAATEPSPAVNPEVIGRTNFAGFEEWSRTASPAVASALEDMEIDSNLAGLAFMSGLDNFTKLE